MAHEHSKSGTLVVVGSERLGRGDDGLGAKLMASFLRTLAAVEPRPDAVIFYNSAVKLLAHGSACLDGLHALDEHGVDLLACVTCLEFFDLTEKMALGHVSNMREIVQRMTAASKVVTV